MKCISCGKDFEGKFCPYCGTKAVDDSDMLKKKPGKNRHAFCWNCGETLKAGVNFCPKCGTNIMESESDSDDINNDDELKNNKILKFFEKLPSKPPLRWRLMMGFFFLVVIFSVTGYWETAICFLFAGILLFNKIYEKFTGKKKILLFIGVSISFLTGVVFFTIKEDTALIDNHESQVSDKIQSGFDAMEAVLDIFEDEKQLEEDHMTESEPSERILTDQELLNYKDLYVGSWSDKNSQRCWLTIMSEDGMHYEIDVNWSSSASENTHWMFYGVLDESTGNINYTGDCINEIYYDNGNVEKEFVYTDGNGQFYIGKYNLLIWDDQEENAGADCLFEKEGEYAVESNAPWYNVYSKYRSVTSDDIQFEISCMNDVMLWVDFYVGTEVLTWTFDVEPSKIGEEGELIYYDADFGSDIMIYYPESNYIYFDTTDGLFEGEYCPY